MSCHRVRRALLGMTRFGEFGPDSELHLDHLSACRPCRDEVGCDRELIRQLRVALAARVEGMEPRATVWDQVRVLAQQPERARFRWPWRRASDAIGVSRSLTAMAGTGLALVLALNTQVVTVTQPSPSAASPLAVGGAADGLPSAWDRLPRLAGPGSASGAERSSIIFSSGPDPEGLVVNVDATQVTASLTDPAVEEPADAVPASETFLVTLPLAPEPPPASAARGGSREPEPAEPAPPEAGDPT